MPASVDTKVASKMGMNTSVGCAAPICARYTKMLTGIIVRPDVLSTRNIIIGFDAVSFLGLSSCMPSMALRPSGVAALSSPSMLAEMFMKMLPTTGCPLGMSGKSLEKSGPSRRARALTTPPRSPIFITPSQKANTPVRPSEISKAVFDESKVDCMMAGNTSVSPINTSLTSAMAKAMTKKAIQMMLRTIDKWVLRGGRDRPSAVARNARL